MQETLLGEKKGAVEIKESYGGFEVCNSDSIDFKDVQVKPFRMGDMIIKQHPSYEEAKESFEKECRVAYQTDVIWKKSKFQDSNGIFWLDGVKIKWELRTFYITTYHLEFNSEKKTPSLLTETGYLSDFPMNLDCYDSIKDYLKDLVEYKINKEYGKDKKKPREYKLTWEDTGYNPSKQFTLNEMKGGGN